MTHPSIRFGRSLAALSVSCTVALTGLMTAGCSDDDNGGTQDGSLVDGARDAAVHEDASQRDAAQNSDASTDPDGSTPVPTNCDPLPEPEGNIVEVAPAQASELAQMIRDAQPGTTFVLADGLYDMSGGDSGYRLQFTTPNVTLRSASGNPEAVVLDAGYQTHELVSISASNITIAEVTLQKAYDHPIHITGSDDSDIEGVVIYRVRVIDPGQQGIKVNSSYAGHYADRGRIECSSILLTDEGRPHIRDNCYTGGIDMHKAWGWVIRLNHIEGFWCDSGLSEHGIHLWRQCRDTLVERNLVLNCARGIGFGLSTQPDDNPRVYPDDPYPDVGYMDHIDGVIKNNMVAADFPGYDSGIILWAAHGAQVYHNTVISLSGGFSGIEWRFEPTSGQVKNNLTNLPIMARDDVPVEVGGNIEDIEPAALVDPAHGDLHVDTNAMAAAPIIDAGEVLDPGLCDEDFDGQSRDAAPDVGADEVVE